MPSATAEKVETPPTRAPFEFPPATKSVTYRGVIYTFRELTVGENDMCRELATNPTTKEIDGRAWTRAMIVTGAVSPAMTSDQLSILPTRLYARIVELVNELNDVDTLDEDEDPGNSSPSET